MLQFLIGTWFICSTNFPMWTKGDKLHPTFNYTIQNEQKKILYDVVKYTKKGKEKSIKGYDRQDNNDPSKFTWRGKGLLFIAKSKWQVVLQDPKGNWAVIYFSKTLFTPEGVDIISRQPELSKAEVQKIKAEMLKKDILKDQVATLKNL